MPSPPAPPPRLTATAIPKPPASALMLALSVANTSTAPEFTVLCWIEASTLVRIELCEAAAAPARATAFWVPALAATATAPAIV